MNLLLVSVLLACFSLASASPFQKCRYYSTDGFQINSIEIDGCDDTAEKCEFPPNEKVNFRIKFTPKVEIKRIIAIIKTRQIPTHYGREVDFPIDDYQLCKVLDCPLKVGQEYTYTSKFLAKMFHTNPIDIEGQFRFFDFPNTQFNCIKFEAHQKNQYIELETLFKKLSS